MASYAAIAIVALLGVVGAVAQDTASGHQRVNAICAGSSTLSSSDVLAVSDLFTDKVDTLFVGNARKLNQAHQKSILCAKPATYIDSAGKFAKSRLPASWRSLAWQAAIIGKSEAVGSSAAFSLVNKFFKEFGGTLPTGLYADILIEEHAAKASTKSAVYLLCYGVAQKCYVSKASTNSATHKATTLSTVTSAIVNPQGCGYQWFPACNCWQWVCI